MSGGYRFSMLTLLYAIMNMALALDYFTRWKDLLINGTLASVVWLIPLMIGCVGVVEKCIASNEKLSLKYPRWRHVFAYLFFSTLFVFPIYKAFTYSNNDYNPEKTYKYREYLKGGRSIMESSSGARLNREAEASTYAIGYALISVWLGFTAFSFDLILRSKKKKNEGR